jgi:hypothetical protein
MFIGWIILKMEDKGVYAILTRTEIKTQQSEVAG